MSTFRSLDAVAAFLAALPGERRLVGVVGAPGAGKSTVAEALAAAIPESIAVPMDGYHLPQHVLRTLGRRDRMGAADTFDVAAFVALLEDLRFSGGTVLARGFDRDIEEPILDAIAVAPEKRIIIVEGNYLLHDEGGWERVAPLLDVSFVVDTDDDVRRARLVQRHERFGKTPDEARAWTLGPDERNARVIATGSARADHRIALP